MAHIDFRGWRIQSDPECWALGKPAVRRNKKQEEEEYIAHPTYHSTLEQALAALVQRELRACDAASATELLDYLKQLRAELAEMVPV